MLRKSTLLAATAALSLAFPVAACAQEAETVIEPVETTQEVEADVQALTDETISERRAELLAEAIEALNETQKAITALEEENAQEALDALAVATGKLELILARDPGLSLAPVDVSIIERDVLTTPEAVRELRDEIEELTDDGRLQEARRLIAGLASEIVIRTANLPLLTYPDAIKLAAAQLDRGEEELALSTLNTALSTIVVTEATVPLPMLRAEASVDAARELLDDAGGVTALSAEQKEQIAIHLGAARTQLEMAEALGYEAGDARDEFDDDIEQLEEQIEAGEESDSLFDSIKRQFNSLRDRLTT
jgi:hypothetical protein